MSHKGTSSRKDSTSDSFYDFDEEYFSTDEAPYTFVSRTDLSFTSRPILEDNDAKKTAAYQSEVHPVVKMARIYRRNDVVFYTFLCMALLSIAMALLLLLLLMEDLRVLFAVVFESISACLLGYFMHSKRAFSRYGPTRFLPVLLLHLASVLIVLFAELNKKSFLKEVLLIPMLLSLAVHFLYLLVLCLRGLPVMKWEAVKKATPWYYVYLNLESRLREAPPQPDARDNAPTDGMV